MSIKLSLATILAATTVLISAPAHAQPTRSIGSGVTALRIENSFIQLLANEGIRTRPLEESSSVRGAVLFPINEGIIDFATARGEIEHSGGQRLANSSTIVKLWNYNIDTTLLTPVLTAEVELNDQLIGRLPLFDLQFANLSTPLQPRRGTLRFTDVTLILRSEGADALNAAFSSIAFAAGQPYGTASVNMILGQSTPLPRPIFPRTPAE